MSEYAELKRKLDRAATDFCDLNVGDVADDARNAIEALEAEVARLNEWADGMGDAVLKERRAAEEYQRDLRGALVEARRRLRKNRLSWNGPQFEAVAAINRALGEDPPEDLPGLGAALSESES